MRRIGIFGGSFNPIHFGHLLAAQAAKERLRLDEVVFVPCSASAYGKKLLPASLRLRLIKLALRGRRGFKVSDIEVRRGGVSRTIDTVESLRAALPKGQPPFLLIGQDQVAHFPRWKEAGRLSKLAKICVLSRPGLKIPKVIPKKYGMSALKIPQCEISSTEIRRRLAKGLAISWLMPAESAQVLIQAYR